MYYVRTVRRHDNDHGIDYSVEVPPRPRRTGACCEHVLLVGLRIIFLFQGCQALSQQLSFEAAHVFTRNNFPFCVSATEANPDVSQPESCDISPTVSDWHS